MHEVIQHGWLVKSPQEAKDRLFGTIIKKQWKKRYFVLSYLSPVKKCNKIHPRSSLTSSLSSTLNLNVSFNDNKGCAERDKLELRYYENEKMSKLHGCIDLMRCEEVLSHLQSPLFKHVFAVKTYHKNTKPRTYYLVASSEHEMNTWVGLLTTYLRMLTDNSRDRQHLQPAPSINSLCRSFQRQQSTVSNNFSSPNTSHYTFSHYPSNFLTSTNHGSSSISNLDPLVLQNGLYSTTNSRNMCSTDNLPSLPRTPYLRRMDSITQRSKRPPSSKLSDFSNSFQSFRNNFPPCTPLPDLHAFLPLLSQSNSTLPRSRVQCQAESGFGLYDHPAPIKDHHVFLDRVQKNMKFNCISIDRRKVSNPLGTVYDIPSRKEPLSPSFHANPHPTHPTDETSFSNPLPSNDPYDVPACIKVLSNIYDTPASRRKVLASNEDLQQMPQQTTLKKDSFCEQADHCFQTSLV